MLKLTARMKLVLRAMLAADGPESPNTIARRAGFQTGHREKGPQTSHNGRCMGPAQRINFALTGLRERGLVRMTSRRDGLSGSAYELTYEGKLAAEALL